MQQHPPQTLFELLPLITNTPPSWATSGNAQTILGHFVPSPPLRDKGTQWNIALPDGDTLVAFSYMGSSPWVVFLFHGLGGHAHADYMRRTARLCFAQGHSVVLVNHRGCGDGQKLAKRPYHAGCAEDLSAVLAYGKDMFPNKKQLAIGFSLSGNALLLLLAGYKDLDLNRPLTKPNAGISINAPIDLELSSTSLAKGFNRLYDFRFVNKLSPLARAHGINLSKKSTMRDFDEHFTAPKAGFLSRSDYYETCSSKPWLCNISTPTLLIHSCDDPMVPDQAYKNISLSSSCIVHTEQSGGHMGYISRRLTPLNSYRWLDYALDAYIKSITSSCPRQATPAHK